MRKHTGSNPAPGTNSKAIKMEIVFKSEKGNAVTNSLLIADKFEKDHKHVLESIRNLVAENSAAKFFYESTYVNRGKTYPMYIMNRDGFSLLVMGFTGEKALEFKIEYINAFNKMEAQLKALNPGNMSRLQLIEIALEAEKGRLKLEAENKQLRPKAELAERILETNDLIDVGQVSKVLDLPFGRNTLFKELRARGVFFKNRNEPMQYYINRGYFKLKERLVERENHEDFTVIKVLVTQKGLLFLSKLFNVDLPRLQMAKIA